MIDVDELARVYPEVGASIGWRNLRAVWPNYAALPNLKVIIPVCIDSTRDLEELQNATPSSKFTICELVADELVLKERVTRREPNEYWQSKLRNLVERHLERFHREIRPFLVRTDDRSVDEAATQILNRLGWKPVEPEGKG